MINLSESGMYEHSGVLIQPFPNGTAMQVKLAPDRLDVRTRTVPGDKANETKGDTPKWLTAYDYVISEWVLSNSPVWQWLKEKGIDETAVHKRILKLK